MEGRTSNLFVPEKNKRQGKKKKNKRPSRQQTRTICRRSKGSCVNATGVRQQASIIFGAKFFPRIWQSSLGCSSVPRGGTDVVVFLLTRVLSTSVGQSVHSPPPLSSVVIFMGGGVSLRGSRVVFTLPSLGLFLFSLALMRLRLVPQPALLHGTTAGPVEGPACVLPRSLGVC